MPQIENLREYNEKLLLVGNEAAIQEERGIRALVSDPPEPDEIKAILDVNALNVRKVAPTGAPAAAASPLDDLLSSALGGSEGGSKPADDFSDIFGSSDSSDGDEAAGGADDFFSDIFGDTPADEPEAEPEVEVEEPSPEEEALLDDFLSAFGGEEPSDDFVAPEPDEPSDDFVAPEPDEPSDDFGAPEPDEPSDDLAEAAPAAYDFADLGADFGVQDTDIDSPPASLESGTDSGGLGSLDDLLGGGPGDTPDFGGFGDDDFGDADTGAADEVPDNLFTLDEPAGADAGASPGEFGDEPDLSDFADSSLPSGDEFGLSDGFEFDAEEDDGAPAGGSAAGPAGGGAAGGAAAQSPDSLDSLDDLADFAEPEDLPEAPGLGDLEFSDTTEDVGLSLDAELDKEFEGEAEFADEFSMQDFGADFGILEESEQVAALHEEELAADAAAEEMAAATASEQAGAWGISEKQYDILKKVTDLLPLNVKSAVAEVISDPSANFDAVKELILALASAEQPRRIAAIVSKISGKRVVVPKGYEKRSGLAFAEEQEGFLYQFKTKIWPMLRVGILASAALALVIYLSYNFVYRPLHALDLYNQGLAAIADKQFDRGNNLFDRAWATWEDQGRFFEYADAFEAQGQKTLATQKYEQLLALFPMHREGILRFADFLAFRERRYQQGLDILQRLLDVSKNDYDPLLKSGDIYLEWARYSDTEAQKTQNLNYARSAYLRLSEIYGQTDTLLFRLLLYFVRAQDLDRSFRLVRDLRRDGRAQIEPQIYAEAAGFFLDTWVSGQTTPILSTDSDSIQLRSFAPDLLETAQEILLEALAVNSRVAEIHYQLARSYAEQERWGQESLALASARFLYEEAEQSRSLSRFERAQYIDTVARIGESQVRSGNLLSGEQELRRAVQLYEANKAADKFQPEHTWGRIYADLGDLYYFEGNDYESADNFYRGALANGYGVGNRPRYPTLLRDLQYRLAFIAYGKGGRENFVEALDFLYKAEGPSPSINPNLVYAQANTQFQLGNYSVSAALYQRVLARLLEQRESIATFLVREDDAHRGIIDFLIRSYNNLGVALFELSRSAGVDRTRRQIEAQYYFTKATELSENVNRDDETAVRSESRSLPFLNLRAVLVPRFEGQVLLDPDIPKDAHDTTF